MSRTPRGFRSAAIGGCLALLVLAGCDTVEAPPPPDAVPPMVSELSITPSSVSVDTLSVVGGEVDIPLSLELSVQPGDAPIQRVVYALQWQFECRPGELEDTGLMEPVDGGRYVATPDFVVPFGRRGSYRLTTWAVDVAGIPSNEASATFRLEGTNLGPPVIDQVVAPAQLSPPASLRFVVNVTDPDGIDHIARAEVDVPGGGTLPLSDTDTAGNNTACDGTYSITFNVGGATEPGLATFIFRAYDRDGAVSEDVPFTVEILE